MARRKYLLPAAVAAALLVAACGSSAPRASIAGATSSPSALISPAPSTTLAPGSPGASGSAGASASQGESAAASTGAGASPVNPASSGPSLPIPSIDMHADTSLEALLPSTVAGQTLQKVSFSLAQLGAIGNATNGDQTFNQWLSSLGKSPSDVNLAVASSESGSGVTITAISVNGANQGQLVSSFVQNAQSQKMTVTQTTLGGKQVARIDDPANANQLSYAYANGDVLFLVETNDQSTAGAALSALP